MNMSVRSIQGSIQPDPLPCISISTLTQGTIHLRAEISSQARISGPKSKFQAEIPGKKMGLIFVLLAWCKHCYCSCDFSIKFDLKTCKIQTSNDILASNFLAWNFGLEFWPEKIKPEARIPGQKFRPEKLFRLADELTLSIIHTMKYGILSFIWLWFPFQYRDLSMNDRGLIKSVPKIEFCR